jgi:hypothetical protein
MRRYFGFSVGFSSAFAGVSIVGRNPGGSVRSQSDSCSVYPGAVRLRSDGCFPVEQKKGRQVPAGPAPCFVSLI